MIFSMNQWAWFTDWRLSNPLNSGLRFGPSKPMVTGSNPVGIAKHFNDLLPVSCYGVSMILAGLRDVYSAAFSDGSSRPA